jgi:hypothetical protein
MMSFTMEEKYEMKKFLLAFISEILTALSNHHNTSNSIYISVSLSLVLLQLFWWENIQGRACKQSAKERGSY